MNRSSAALIFLIALLVSITASANSKIIPQAGHAPGGNNTMWTTDLTLKNNDSSATTVTLEMRTDDGGVFSRTVSLAANQSVLLQDAVNPFYFSGAGRSSWLGQLEVSSSNNISASADIHTTTAAGGTYGSSFASFDANVLSTHGYVAGLLSSARSRSNIAFANGNDTKISIDYVVRRPDGTVAATKRIEVEKRRTLQIPLANDIVTTDDQPLMLEWSASAPAYVVASIVDNASGDPTAIPSVTNGTTTLSFPIIGKTPGQLGSFWTTSVAVTSVGDSPGSITLVYQSNEGTLFTKSVSLAPHSSFRTADVNGFVGAPDGSGTLRIESTTRVVGAVRVFNTQANGATFGSAVLPQEPSVRASSIRISGVRRDADFRLNVAIANDENSGVDGTIRLFDHRAREVEAQTFHVDAHRSLQLAMNKSSDVVAGGDVLVTTKEGALVTVLASTVDNRTGDTLLTEVDQENERQTELDIRVSPFILSVNSPASFTLLSGNQTVSSVAWRFGDGGTATGPNVTHTWTSPGEYEVAADVTLTNGTVLHEREDVVVLTNGSSNSGVDFDWTPSAPSVNQTITFHVITDTTLGGSYVWTFPGGIKKSGSVVTHSFPTAGLYEVEVELERQGSVTRRTDHTVRVGSTGGDAGASIVNFTWSPIGARVGELVTFTATFDNNPAVGAVVKWRFPNDARPEGTTVKYTFNAPATYTIRVELEQPGRPSIQREKPVVISP
jgi:hypothetical protein